MEPTDLKIPIYRTILEQHFSPSQIHNLCQARMDLLTKIPDYLFEPKPYLPDMKDLSPKVSQLFLTYRESLLQNVNGLSNAYDQDQCSFQLLLVLFSSASPKNMEWYIKQECCVLQWRLHDLNKGENNDFSQLVQALRKLYSHQSGELVNITAQERDTLLTIGSKFYVNINPSPRYKIPFSSCPSLVGKRCNLIRYGYLFINEKDAVYYYFIYLFKKELKRQLAALTAKLPSIYAMYPDLEVVFTTLLSKHSETRYWNPATQGKPINMQNLAAVSQSSFPLCMLLLTKESLTKGSYLYNLGRWQLIAFLKTIGFSFESALKLLLQHYGKRYKTNEHTSVVNYIYEYGGATAISGGQYAHSCAKIIQMDTPTSQQHHGCPYKNFNTQQLTKLLEDNYGLRASDKIFPKIIESKGAGHYGEAPIRSVISHPVQFYAASLDYERRQDEQRKVRENFLDLY